MEQKRSFEDFYKAVTKMIDEEKEATAEQKAAIFSGLDQARPFIEALSQEADELGLTDAERYVLAYLLEHGEAKNKATAMEFAVIQLASMMFVHEHKRTVTALYSDVEARIKLINSMTDDDLRDIKLSPDDMRVKSLLENTTPSLDDILEVIGFGNAVIVYERHSKYKTKARAEEAGAVTEPPAHLIIPTLKPYQHSMSLCQDGSAYLQPFSNMEGLQFKDGKLYFQGGREISEIELRNLKTKEGIQDIDLTSLRFYYSILFDQFSRSGCKVLQDIIMVHVSMLAGRNDPDEEDIKAAIAKTQSYHNVMGVLKGKNGRESYYQVLNFEFYDEKHNIIAFSSPYMNYVIKTIYNLSIRRNKDGKPKLKRNGEPLKIASHSYLIDSSITKERNKAAVENVIIIVTLIEQAGDNLPRIRASKIIERNVQLAERLETVQNPRTLLKTTFKKTWELLRKKTRLTEVYKEIQLPDPDDPAFMPTMRTLDKVVFEFPHKGKK